MHRLSRTFVALLTFVAFLLCASPGKAQQPRIANALFGPVTMGGSGQTSTAIHLGSSNGASGSYSVGVITVTGLGLVTATFGVQGSADGGATYVPINVSAILTPGTKATTATVTTASLYQVSLQGLTHIRFVTSGTFTAISISLTLTASPTGVVQ